MTPFHELGLPQPIQSALKSMKFHKATEVQAAAIPTGLEGQDLIVSAETGSGKTAAYCLPMITHLFNDKNKKGLVLAPTRELAKQISDVVRDLISDSRNLKMSTLVGGVDLRKQMRSLKRNPQIIIATPGRLMDHVRRGSIELSNAGVLVLDEADRMLDMGFAPQIEEILKKLPKKRQTMMFSATVPPKVEKLMNKSMRGNSVRIQIGDQSKPVETIKQMVVQTTQRGKNDTLIEEISNSEGSIIVFAKTQVRVEKLTKYLNEYGLKVTRIHGGRSQGQRNRAITDFRNGKYSILCATDVAARGIDVPHVENVINFDLPMMDEDYVHRIGRTARNGAEGRALSFVTPEEHRTWKALVRKYRIPDVELEKVSREDRSEGRGDNDRRKKKFGQRSKPTGELRRSSVRRERNEKWNDERRENSQRRDDSRRGGKRWGSERDDRRNDNRNDDNRRGGGKRWGKSNDDRRGRNGERRSFKKRDDDRRGSRSEYRDRSDFRDEEKREWRSDERRPKETKPKRKASGNDRRKKRGSVKGRQSGAAPGGRVFSGGKRKKRR